jgi:hypothetical protein
MFKNLTTKPGRILFCNLIFLIAFSALETTAQTAAEKGLEKISSSLISTGKVPEIITQTRNITITDGNFVDPTGRTMFLRGINLGGSTKVPFSPDGATHITKGFFNGKEVSFVGRPFPLKNADEHFSRLKAWGYHFLRFLVTWEAIEHEGPGIYDKEYLAYIKAIVSKANEYGINVMIDPHEDVWSRFSGGDGAPLWTFEIAGMDATKFQETGAAFIHNIYGDPFPKMIWYTNNYKLASSTLFTLFFGGNDFAPKTKVGSIPIQDFLQQHYIDALVQVARELKDLPNVVGFELMNEPSAGYIGIEDITQPYHTEVTGDAPTPWQGILLGEGVTQKIKKYRVGAVSLKDGGETVWNQEKVSVWNDGQPGIWIQNGVGEKQSDGSIKLKNAAYFSTVNGQKVDFNKMYYEPFALKYANAIHAVDNNWIICVDNALSPYAHDLPDLKELKGVDWINGSHWYDDVTLVKKQYLPYLGFYKGKIIFGKNKVQKAYEKTLADMIDQTHEHFGNVPSLLGEFGIPYDMNKANAYKTGNFNTQTKALDRSFRVAEKNVLNYTLWNYTADNTNERGDKWNGEDLSIFSISQQTNPEDINSGGRALDAAVRPFPKKVTGKLLEYCYNYRKKELLVRFKAEKLSGYPTEIFLPEYTYGENFIVYSKDTKLAFDKKENTLLCYPQNIGEQVIIIKK